MVDKLINDLDSGTIATNTEIEIQLDGASASTKALISALLSLYDADTAIFTNKTFDANATGNSLSNVENADIAAAAAIAFSKLAALTDGNILVGDASNVVVSVNPSGDIDISNAGVFSIVAGVIVDADITDDTITLTKLVPGTKGEIIGTDGTTRQLLAVGTNAQILTADSGETTGIKWAAAAGGGLTFAKVVKAADETVTSSTTFQDDDEIKFTPSINKTYLCMFFLLDNSPVDPDLKIAWTVPTGATMVGGRDNGILFRTDSAILYDDDAETSRFILGGTTDRSHGFIYRVVMSSTAGDVQLQWAQNTSDATGSKVLKGTMLLAWEEGTT